MGSNDMVRYMQLTKGDEFMVGKDTYETVAVDMPGNGEVVIFAKHQGAYHILYRRVEELAIVPIYG